MFNNIQISIGRQRIKQPCSNLSGAYIDSFRGFLKVCTFLASILIAIFQSGSVLAEALNEGYFGYLFEDGGDYPGSWTETRWSDGFNAMTHDEDNWYLAQTGCGYGCFGLECTRRLWRIPVEIDINTNNHSVWYEYSNGQWISITPPGVQVVYLPDIKNQHYKLTSIHDMAFHRRDGKGYLFVKGYFEEIATGNEYIDGIAVISPGDLTLIDLHIGWTDCIASSPDGRLIRVSGSSAHGTAAAEYITVDWAALSTQGKLVLHFPSQLDPDNFVPIWEPDGTPSEAGPSNCDSSPSGGLLYVLHGGGCASYNRVEVADLTIGKIVQVSTNSDTGDYGHFDVRYDPYICNSADSQHLEGLTVWDLDADTRAPNIHGKLHIGVVNVDDWEFSCTDDIRMMHYTGDVHVVQDSTATPERGTQNHPYNTLAEGIAGAWDYSKLYIWGSNYPETVIFDKKMDVVPLVFTSPYTLTIGE